MKNVLIYTRESYCKFCEAAKNLLDEHDISYEEMVVGFDITRDDFLAEFPGQKTVPLIYVDGERVGGFDDLKAYMEEHSGGYGEDAL